MSDYSTITFDGDQGGTYYVAADLVQYLSPDLFNNGSQTIYLYSDRTTHNNVITIYSLSYPRYRSGNNYSTYSYITNAENVTFSDYGNFAREKELISYVVLFIIGFYCLVRLFKK